MNERRYAIALHAAMLSLLYVVSEHFQLLTVYK